MPSEIQSLAAALPSEGFDFYEQGMVEPIERPELAQADLESKRAIGFDLKGDLNGLFILLHDSGLDESTYTEMGNVLASRWVTRLSTQGIDILISPPFAVPGPRLRLLLQSGNGVLRRHYIHRTSRGTVSIEALVITRPLEGLANA